MDKEDLRLLAQEKCLDGADTRGRPFQLEHLRRQLESHSITQTTTTTSVLENNPLELGLKGLLSNFNPEEGDMAMVLLSSCTPTEILKNSEETWAPHLTDIY
ncbi:hypothetical protein NPIL_378481 [Nephila pilipes]|uniref:Uncharacterized protein n=1 Tax=Nephila pilipes TaxID=299642 RepID=A0A8X6TWA6_NEPPI|nr:hypothetical protein NPIL_378481 [Nephila pilipes]